MAKSNLFKRSKPIRLGIWGLGRGASFYEAAREIGFEIVAGCDFNEPMRARFLQDNPGAWATSDAQEFLARDFDAVLLATFCPAHADDAIACLRAGKHVLSEVTAFHTLAEGVRLVEAVQHSGKVYNLAENYPFKKPEFWLAEQWRRGLFGELMYAEFEYVHEIRQLAYTYIDGSPIRPGWQAHSWRSWLNFHYYNTHSLGPMMHITGLRPTRVTALPSAVSLDGYPVGGPDNPHVGMGSMTPSLIQMSNGAVVRNLMGASTSDGHLQRIWGTKGAAEYHDKQLHLRLGGSGLSPRFEVEPTWGELEKHAAGSGHGGADFWVLYYFAREILEGTPAPFDIYSACDCTIPGILALRSQVNAGQPLDVPDFRDQSQRDAHRDDDWKSPRFDHVNGLFPPHHDKELTQHFSRTMSDLIEHAVAFRALRDWHQVAPAVKQPVKLQTLLENVQTRLPAMVRTYKKAREIADAYPNSVASRVLNEMLGHGCEAQVLERQPLKSFVKGPRAIASLSKHDSFAPPFVTLWRVADTLTPRPAKGIAAVKAPAKIKLTWSSLGQTGPSDRPGILTGFVCLHDRFQSSDGIAWACNEFHVDQPGAYNILLGHDGGVRLFVNGKALYTQPKRVNPAQPDRATIPVKLKRGQNQIVIAMDTDQGNGWGFFLRFEGAGQAKNVALPKLHLATDFFTVDGKLTLAAV